jgi:hypothetical protein
VSELETAAEVVVTEASVVGKAPVAVPFAFTDGAEATTALSEVGKSGGALVAGAGELETSADCVSGFWGSEGAAELFFSIAAC